VALPLLILSLIGTWKFERGNITMVIAKGKRKNLVPLDYDDEPEWGDQEYAQDYTGGSYDINDYLHRQYRKQAKPKELKEFLKKIQALDRLLANHKLPQQIVVYTGLKQSPSEAWETYGADVSKPIRLHLPAYTSTTTQLRTALQRVEDEVVQVPRARHKPRNKDAPKDDDWGSQVLMISLPAGTPAASVRKVSEYPDENEILLPRGMDIEINPRPTVLKGGDYVWHAQALGHSPVQIAPPIQEMQDSELEETHDLNPNRIDIFYRPDPQSHGRRVVAKNVPTTALDQLLAKLSQKFGVRDTDFEWTAADSKDYVEEHRS
jgi:hypothetical protein